MEMAAQVKDRLGMRNFLAAHVVVGAPHCQQAKMEPI